MNRSNIQIRDPYVLPLPDEHRYLLFGTTGRNAWSGPGLGFACYESRDLEKWSGPIPAFRPPPGFWSNTQFWAPECHPWQGRYYVFASQYLFSK
jgi:arabinan endo-1,5-alpha-L-arabinosidase